LKSAPESRHSPRGEARAARDDICGALFGSTALGLALAAIRRARDLVWIGAGLVIGSAFSMSLPDTVPDSEGVA